MAESRDAYSSNVSLCLIVGGKVIPLASLGHQVCTAKTDLPQSPESDAQLVIDVDGDVARYSVRLVDGLQANSRQIRFSSHGSVPVAAGSADSRGF
jgi:hypothetical protein